MEVKFHTRALAKPRLIWSRNMVFWCFAIGAKKALHGIPRFVVTCGHVGQVNYFACHASFPEVL